ncbi:MAG: sulfatase-like hydrolase/transferase, partial [Acidimicrobiia bacterium]
SLLDGTGAIDRELFPNFDALADDATWYRNHTTVASKTVWAVPALLTGRYQPDALARPDPENLFALLAERYEVTAREAVTRLCPADVCERPMPSALRPLLGDASRWWRLGSTLDDVGAMLPTLPGATGPGRYEAAREAIAELDLAGGDRPPFAFLHVLVPHVPWHYTDTGELYEPSPQMPGSLAFGTWGAAGIDVARQRHVLQVQAADALLGQLLDRLREADLYDDALVVVAGDHGVAFQPFRPTRELVAGNEHEILWTPLLVKAPGQTAGAVDDANVRSIDVVPTIASILGIDLPWEVDGVPAPTAAAERPDHVTPWAWPYDGDGDGDPEEPSGDPPVVEIETAAMFERMLASDFVAAEGPDGAWRLTEFGAAIGQPVDRYAAGDPVDATVTVTWPDGFDGIDTDEPLPLELLAGTDLPAGATVAFALDGTIAAMGEVQDHPEGDGLLVQGLLVPWAFHDGDHELEAFVVTGDPSAPVLAPVAVAW